MTEHRIKPGQGKKCKSGGASVTVGVVGALLMMSRNYRTASTSVNEAGSLGVMVWTGSAQGGFSESLWSQWISVPWGWLGCNRRNCHWR